MPPLSDLAALDDLRESLALTGQRRLLVVAGRACWGREAVAALAQRWLGRWLWAGTDCPLTDVTLVPPEQPSAVLGGEWDVAVVDAFAGLAPDMLGAAGGAICGGGLLILLAPPLVEWEKWRDPDYRRMAVYPVAIESMSNRFWCRLRQLLDDPAVLLWREALPTLSGAGVAAATAGFDGTAGAAAADRYAEQEGAVTAVLRCLRGRAGRPLVLVADRGRGKSAALGLAAAALVGSGREVIVTGPRPDACRVLFRHAAAALGLPTPPAEKTLQLQSGGTLLRFVPFDALVEAGAEAIAGGGVVPALLVDEAAALPVSVLSRLLRFPRVVFASTVHGYEGSGRGFELRFLPLIERHAPRWRRLALRHPLRWADDDPLERWLYRALLLDAVPMSAESGGPLRIEQLDRDRLVGDEALLRQVYGLLVQAHYRTSPDDLRQLLDGSDLAVWAALQGGAVVGVVLVAAEGMLPAELHEPILKGLRRPRGHLLPQSLAFHGGVTWPLSTRWWRVVRIAVAGERQRQGIGSAMLAHLATAAGSERIDCLGVSFAASTQVLEFWRQSGFRLLRVGVRRETGSAGEALMLARPLPASTLERVQQLHDRMARSLSLRLADHLRHWDSTLVAAVLRAAPGTEPWDEADQAEFERYLAGQLPLESCLATVALFCRMRLGQVAPAPGGAALIVDRLLQLRPWPEVVRRNGCRGRADAECQLRASVAQLRETTVE